MHVKNTWLLYLSAVVVAFGSFVFGYALVCTSMMSGNILQAHPMQSKEFDYQLSLITTLLPLGAFIGSFFIQPLCNQFGQHKTMMMLDLFGTYAIALQAYQLQFWSIYLGRFLLGMYVGIASGIIPVYLISISPPEISGIVGSFNQLLITLGIATAYGIGMLKWTWGLYIFFPASFCIVRFIYLIGFRYIYNLIRFDTLERLFRNNDIRSLEEYLKLFYEDGSIDQLAILRGINSVENVYNKVSNISQSGLWGFLGRFSSNSHKNIIKLGLILALANQFSGINAILFYAKQVFEHITNNNIELANSYTLYLGILQVVITFGSGFLINRFGRRSLMLFGQALVVGSLISGFFFEKILKNSERVMATVVFIHIIGFSISLGPVSMLYVAEMMQNVTLVIFTVWIFTLFVSMVSEMMIKEIGIGNVFLFYGVISFYCLTYLYRNMAQSKGLSRKELVVKLSGQGVFQYFELQEQVKLRQRDEVE